MGLYGWDMWPVTYACLIKLKKETFFMFEACSYRSPLDVNKEGCNPDHYNLSKDIAG